MPARRTARLGAAVVLLLAGGALVGPARAAAPVGSARSSMASLPDWVATRGADGQMHLSAPKLDRAALLRRVDPLAGVRGMMDATRALLEAQQHLKLPDLDPTTRLSMSDDAPPGGDDGSSGVQPHGTSAFPSPAGDLNGDGADDVLVYQVNRPYPGDYSNVTIGVQAMSGRDGAVLWSRPAVPESEGIALPISDVNGDRLPDLARLVVRLLSVQSEDDCNEGGCSRRRYHETFQWTYGAVSGATGADLWSKTLDGEFTEEDASSSSGHLKSSTNDEAHAHSVNGWVLLFGGADDDHDGRADLVFDSLSTTWDSKYRSSETALVLAKTSESRSTRGTTDGEVLSGSTGAPLLTREARDVPELAALLPAPNLVGDPTADLLWDTYAVEDSSSSCRYVDAVVVGVPLKCKDSGGSTGSEVVTVVDGATSADAWSTSAPDSLSFIFTSPDLNGDGIAEIAWVRPMGDEHTDVRSGRDGTPLWSAAGVPIRLGVDVDGSGAPGVVLVSMQFDESDGQATLVFDRRAGATGALVSETGTTLDSGVPEPTWSYLYLDGIGNAGGSPAPDLLYGMDAGGTDEAGQGRQGSHWVVEDGRGGHLLDRRSDSLRMMAPLADVDGDGLSEVVDGVMGTDDFGYPSLSSAIVARVADGTTSRLWDVPAQEDTMDGGNQDGAPGHEVIAFKTQVADDGLVSSTIESLDGPTGARRWVFTL